MEQEISNLSQGDPVSSRPTQEARRRQILDAACDCARRSGFHGASMAEIAQAAGMSVGQIYRHFENKEAIIAAIVERDGEAMREKFSQMETFGGRLCEEIVDACGRAVGPNYDPERTALMLEMLAEAARNPQVGATLQAADAKERGYKLRLLRQASGPGCSDRELIARGEALSMLFEGMAVRSVNNPDSDKAAICEVVRDLVRHLLSRPCTAHSPAE